MKFHSATIIEFMKFQNSCWKWIYVNVKFMLKILLCNWKKYKIHNIVFDTQTELVWKGS